MDLFSHEGFFKKMAVYWEWWTYVYVVVAPSVNQKIFPPQNIVFLTIQRS